MLTGKSTGVWGVALFAAAFGLFAWTAYQGFQRLSAHWSPQQSIPAGTQPPGSPAISGDFNIAGITDAHIFGQPQQESSPEREKAPETKLRIRLMGLVASTDEHLSRAIIQVEGTKTKPYAVGQAIEGTDATLHAVENRRVLLKRSDALESLRLKRQDLADSTKTSTIAIQDAAPNTPARSQEPTDQQTNELQEQARKIQMRSPF